jgi:CubicO group peptidase (beta-lactamase class C family)
LPAPTGAASIEEGVMTPIEMTGRTVAEPVRSASPFWKILLACGVLASLLYVITDLLGGLRYDGYSFTSQAISELGAIGAPTKSFVDPLFIAYNVLVLAFGVGVLGIGAGRRRTLRTTAVLLLAAALTGLVASVFFSRFFSMDQRGAGSMEGDLPHVVLAGVQLLLQLLAIGFGAFALGRRFRVYSLATLVTVLVLTAMTVPYAARLAVGEATPGLGIIERADVYALMLWLAVLAIALLRGARDHDAGVTRVTARPSIGGQVAPGFEEVRAEFERNFVERGDIGAAVAAYWRGEKVVDLWGGRRTPEGDAPWERDTMAVVMSTTKGLAAMTVAVANSRGWIDYDAPVARYWPEFAQNGKEAITVRQLLGHEAGLVLLDEELTIEKLRDLDYVARLLARQKPAWPPGTRHGYHAMTIGLYMQELIRRVDPAHRSLGRFFREEIAEPLGLVFYIGLPAEIADTRLAKVKPLSRLRAITALRDTPPTLIKKVLWPRSLLRRSLANPVDADFNDRRTLEVEMPAGNGVGTARSIARAYSSFAEGGAELGITPETMARLTAAPEVSRAKDEVIGEPTYLSLGFIRPGPDTSFGSTPRGFGFPGAGGSLGFADPDARLGFAYITNKLDFWLIDDPREKALRDAVYRAIARLSARQPSREIDVRSRHFAVMERAEVAGA